MAGVKRLLFSALTLTALLQHAWAEPPILLQIDASAAQRHHIEIEEQIAVQPGSVQLVFPRWIPGEHGPTGPLNSALDLRLESGSKSGPLTWKRDPLEMSKITVEVPAGVNRLVLRWKQVDSFASERLGVLSFNELVWLPANCDADSVRVQPSVRLPLNWSGVSALNRQPATGLVNLPEVSVAQLIDSPLLMGQHLLQVPLTSPSTGQFPHTITIAAETPQAMELPEKFKEHHVNLVEEVHQLFKSHHYAHYDWLLSMTEVPRAFGGLEHHQCSDNVMPDETMSKPYLTRKLTALMAHEFVHSWCGKFRRPAGLLSPDYQKPMDGSLLWVYEGMTTFWGEILPVRAGSESPEQFRETLATVAAHYDYQQGREWRPLADTATAAQLLYIGPSAWSNSRRRVDFYAESVFLWLEVETELRQRSHGKVGLDDFCKKFFGGPSGQPQVFPYQESEIYQTLGDLVAHDWKTHLRNRLDQTNSKLYLEALEKAGWHLVYNDEKNEEFNEQEGRRKAINRLSSLGLVIGDQGDIVDLNPKGLAGKAGLCPGMKVVAVNRREYSSKYLDALLKESSKSPVTFDLLVKKDGYFSEVQIKYLGGLRIPHLERLADSNDLLSPLLQARRH